MVLEWTNPGCPFVVKHYGSQNMQALQKEAATKNVVWLSISSTAQGHSDYLAPAALAAQYKQWGAAPSAVLMDDSGKVGRAYGARTTPHMYVDRPEGRAGLCRRHRRQAQRQPRATSRPRRTTSALRWASRWPASR